MNTDGIDGILIETHNWGSTVAFWQDLGYELEFETDHHSGRAIPAAGLTSSLQSGRAITCSRSCSASRLPMRRSSRCPVVVLSRDHSNGSTGLPCRCCWPIPTAGNSLWKRLYHRRSSPGPAGDRPKENLCPISKPQRRTAPQCGSPCGVRCTFRSIGRRMSLKTRSASSLQLRRLVGASVRT